MVTRLWVVLLATARALKPSPRGVLRRQLVLPGAFVTLWCRGAPGARADWREYTALAPLGPAERSVGGAKETGLSLERLADRLVRDATLGAHGLGGYFVSGDLDPALFTDDCRFVDPTNDVASLSRYTTALGVLFDPTQSSVELVSGPRLDAAARSISVVLRSQGVLKLPWRPRVREYETSLTWSVGDDGLVRGQSQVWSISAADALIQTFTPGALSPPKTQR